jgi:hypothetical protein
VTNPVVGHLVNPRISFVPWCLGGLFFAVDIISLIILAGVAISGASIVLYTLENGISPSPTGGKVKKHLLNILADQQSGCHIYELGSGWGTLALPIAGLFPASRVIGYENSIVPFLASRLRLAISSTKNLELRWANFFKIDLSNATLVVCYQSPENMSNLRPKFEAELSDDSYVVSNTFAVPGWKPTETYRVDDMFKTSIYVYRVGDTQPLSAT